MTKRKLKTGPTLSKSGVQSIPHNATDGCLTLLVFTGTPALPQDHSTGYDELTVCAPDCQRCR